MWCCKKATLHYKGLKCIKSACGEKSTKNALQLPYVGSIVFIRPLRNTDLFTPYAINNIHINVQIDIEVIGTHRGMSICVLLGKHFEGGAEDVSKI